MKRALMSDVSKRLFRKRSIIETVHDELKNIAQVEQSKHKSFDNFIANCCCVLYSKEALYQSTNFRRTTYIIKFVELRYRNELYYLSLLYALVNGTAAAF